MRTFFSSKKEYYDRYILGLPYEANRAQQLGKIVHAFIEDPRYRWLPELKSLGYTKRDLYPIRKALSKLSPKRPPKSEVVLRGETKDGIKLLSIFDGLDKEERILYEYKTTSEDRAWSQYRVDYNEQLSFYSYVYYLNFHKFLKEIRLYQIDIKKGNVKTFYTARGPKDLDYIKVRINECLVDLKRLGWWELRKSQKERALEKNLKLI
jgi:hypothetical protein